MKKPAYAIIVAIVVVLVGVGLYQFLAPLKMQNSFSTTTEGMRLSQMKQEIKDDIVVYRDNKNKIRNVFVPDKSYFEANFGEKCRLLKAFPEIKIIPGPNSKFRPILKFDEPLNNIYFYVINPPKNINWPAEPSLPFSSLSFVFTRS